MSLAVQALGGGLWRLSQPMEGYLGQVNLYVIQDEDDACLIDTGLAGPGALEDLTTALKDLDSTLVYVHLTAGHLRAEYDQALVRLKAGERDAAR